MGEKEAFEDGSLEERALVKYMRGKEMSVSDAILFSAVSSMISGSLGKSPVDSLESDWDDGSSGIALSSRERRKMYVDSRKLVRRDGLVAGVIRKFMLSICGDGPRLYVRDSNGGKAGVSKKETVGEMWLRTRIEKNLSDFSKLSRLIVAQTFINGDLYLLHFPLGFPGGVHPERRVILPDFLESTKVADSWSLTPSIVSYKFRPVDQFIVADEVTDFHIHEELHDGVHGISVPYYMMKELPRYLDWLHQRVLKSRSDNLTFLIRYLRDATSLKKRELPSRPMQIDAAMDAEKWDAVNMSGGSSSRDATSGDGYEFRMRLATATGLPEHQVTGNAQFAAQMGKDGFPVALFSYYQNVFGPKLLLAAARILGCSPDSIGLMWPQIDMRDRGSRVNEVSELNKNRIISRAEVCRVLGYDSEQNEREINEEMKNEMMVMPSGGSGSLGGFGGVGSLGAMPQMPSSSPLPAGASVNLPGGVTGVHKIDHGYAYVASDFLYVPDVKKPSTWKLRVKEYVNGKKVVTAAQLGRAAAALTEGFMGNKVDIPEADKKKAIGKLLALYRSLGKKPPSKLSAAVPPDSFAGKLMQVGGMSKIGVSTDVITDELPELKVVAAGADYGYALGGALVFGGLTKDNDLVAFGEATMMRVDNEGWIKVCDHVKEKYPKFEMIFTGSDEPALTDQLEKHGYISKAKHLGPDRTRVLLEAFQKDHKIFVYYKCRELLSDLFGPQMDQATGMHLTGGRPDHSDAFRYLAIGLMEQIGAIGSIGSPDGKELAQ